MDVNEAFAPLEDDIGGPGPSRETDNTWRQLTPVPDGAPRLTVALLTRMAPSGYQYNTGWAYRDAEGGLLGAVVRYDRQANGKPADKQFLPFTFCEGPDGRREWRCKGFADPRPLYGLDVLAARPDAPVLVVEGEKTADAAAKLFPAYAVITSSGGSKAAAKADWQPLKGRTVTIWPDNDDPGIRYGDAVADATRKAGATAVHVVTLPDALPAKWDLADALPPGMSVADLEATLNSAGPSAADGPIPLFPQMPVAEPYPIEHMGPVLSRAAAAIAHKVQVPEAIAAQSVLAVAALAAQAHADVMLPYGQTRPLSLFFVTVAASGDRKSTADNEALWPVRKREKMLKEEGEEAHRAWAIAMSAWTAEKKRIESNRKLGFDGKKEALADLGAEPERPLYPFLTAPEPTIEGLVKAWTSAPAALGIFTAEGGMFIGGHGMSQDNRLRTAAGYSEMWDGHPIKRIRSLDGVSILYGRRLSMHLMVQHEAAAQFLADPLLRDQGLLSRVLVAAPESIAGSRFWRDAVPADDVAIKAYGARILSMLEAKWPLAEGKTNELDPRALRISDDAAAAWRAFYDHIERQCGAGNGLKTVQDFAAKVAEHAARIAGVLTIVADLRATEIRLPEMQSALALADWYMNEALRLQRAARTDPRLLRAQQLLDWMRGRKKAVFSFGEICQFAPTAFRLKAGADEALGVLASHGWVEEVSSRPRRIRLIADPAA